MSSEKDRLLGSGAASTGAVLLILPSAPSLSMFSASVLQDSALVRGRPPPGTALCGFDGTGRQTQRAKSRGPFEMSRQEAGLREKQGHSPLTGVCRLPGRLLSLLQEPRGSVRQGLSASSGRRLMKVQGGPGRAPVQQGCAGQSGHGPRAARRGRWPSMTLTLRLGQWALRASSPSQHGACSKRGSASSAVESGRPGG